MTGGPGVSAEVLVIGGGPAGLTVARCLKNLGIQALLVDDAPGPGGAYARMYPEIRLNSPAAFNGLPGAPLQGDEPPTAGAYARYLQSYYEDSKISARFGCAVRQVRQVTGGFEVLTTGGPVQVRAVVAATGMWSFPHRPDVPGLPQTPVLHARDFPGPEPYAGQNVLVVGGGNSAVELAWLLAPAARVFLHSRHPLATVRRRWLGRDLHHFARILEALVPPALLPRYCRGPWTTPGYQDLRDEAMARGTLTLVPGPLTSREDRILLPGGTETPIHAVILATGYRYERPYLPPGPCHPAGQPVGLTGGADPEVPGLYFLGLPCLFSLASPFLRGIAADGPRLARRIAGEMRGRIARPALP